MQGHSRARRIVLAAALAGLCLRLLFGLVYWVDKPMTHDEREYLALARSLANGRGLVHDEAIEVGTGQRFGRAPGYPAFLAAIGAGTVASWTLESHDIARDLVYPRLSVWLFITESYVDEAMPVIEDRLFRAGVRLAGVLNDALR